MKSYDFAKTLSSFLSSYLPGHKNVSVHTIASYRDTFKLFLNFCSNTKGITIEKIRLSTVTKELVIEFLTWIEEERGCSISTRNQRLSAIHAFFRYIQQQSPENIYEAQKIIGIPIKKTANQLMPYLQPDNLRALFAKPDTTTKNGRRDLVLLTLLYDTAARVQELINLKCRDVRVNSPAVITLHGKRNKTRQVPIMGNTQKLLQTYMSETKFSSGIAKEDTLLFCNQRGEKLTRWGISYVIKKYEQLAKTDADFCIDFEITPHVFRHSKAMHLLQSGVNLVYIRDFLGHSSIKTTEIYARADSEMKRKAIEEAYVDLSVGNLPQWKDDEGLMQWLSDLCK